MEQVPEGKVIMTRYHNIEKVLFQDDNMKLKVDGKEYSFALQDISQRLAKATPAERAAYEISPSGYGIHWPLIDEDLSIDGLLGVKHRPGSPSAKMAV
jgi:uncharacterized protein DUF2442